MPHAKISDKPPQKDSTKQQTEIWNTEKCLQIRHVGELVFEENRNQGINNMEGLKFTVHTKEELLSSLKIAMEQNHLATRYHR